MHECGSLPAEANSPKHLCSWQQSHTWVANPSGPPWDLLKLHQKKTKKIKTYRGIHRGHIGSCGQCFRKFSRIVNDLSTCCKFHRELLTNVHANTFYLGCKKEVYDVRSGSSTPLGLGTELCTFEGADQTTLDHLWDNLWVILWILACGCWCKTVVLSSNFPLLGVIYEYY